MPFFESSDALRERMRPKWDKGVADFHTGSVLATPLLVAGGSAGAVAGASWSVVKTGGVAAYEYYDHSFGASRGRNFFDYVTSSPVLEMLAFGALAEGVGVALKTLNLDVPLFGFQSNFAAGVFAYLGTCFARTFPKVWWSATTGFIGGGLTKARQASDGLAKELGLNEKPAAPQ